MAHFEAPGRGTRLRLSEVCGQVQRAGPGTVRQAVTLAVAEQLCTGAIGADGVEAAGCVGGEAAGDAMSRGERGVGTVLGAGAAGRGQRTRSVVAEQTRFRVGRSVRTCLLSHLGRLRVGRCAFVLFEQVSARVTASRRAVVVLVHRP